jgi:hypothetical protein
MHSVFISHHTGSNEEITFDEFYQVISKYHERQKEDKMLRNNWKKEVPWFDESFMNKFTAFSELFKINRITFFYL